MCAPVSTAECPTPLSTGCATWWHRSLPLVAAKPSSGRASALSATYGTSLWRRGPFRGLRLAQVTTGSHAPWALFLRRASEDDQTRCEAATPSPLGETGTVGLRLARRCDTGVACAACGPTAHRSNEVGRLSAAVRTLWRQRSTSLQNRSAVSFVAVARAFWPIVLMRSGLPNRSRTASARASGSSGGTRIPFSPGRM